MCRPKEGTGGLAERALEQRLAHVLSRVIVVEAHPRTTIRCVLQLIHPDGAGLACSVNAACLALMDAGVPLRSCVAAVTLSILPGGDLVLDPTAVEEEVCLCLKPASYTHQCIFRECAQSHEWSQAHGLLWYASHTQHITAHVHVCAAHMRALIPRRYLRCRPRHRRSPLHSPTTARWMAFPTSPSCATPQEITLSTN